MHGAAQTATGPAPTRARQEPGCNHALRDREQPDEREPEHDEDEAGDLRLSALREEVADRRRTGAEDDEDDGESDDERHAGAYDSSGRPPLAEASAFDARERGQVPGYEREHARRDHRREACEERDR
jgi:hypothetical protein